jgi:hypothetical protein
MTVAVGMICKDGVVVASDSEETYQDTRADTNKVEMLDSEHIQAVFAGAGIGYFVDHVRNRIWKMLATLPPINTVEDKLSEIMVDLYQKEFRYYPTSDPTHKSISLLLAVRVGPKSVDYSPMLFSVDSTLVERVQRCRLVGTEELKDEAEELQRLDVFSNQGRMAALYIVWQTKVRFTGVGGKTQSWSLDKRGKFEGIKGWNTPEIEKMFERIRRMQHMLIMGLDNQARSDDYFSKDLKWIAMTMRTTRRQMAKIDKDWGKQRSKAKTAYKKIYQSEPSS